MYRSLPQRVAASPWNKALLLKVALRSAVIASMRESLLRTKALHDPNWLRSKTAPKVSDLVLEAWFFFGSVAKA